MTDTHDEYLELHRQHVVGYTRAEVIAILEGNMDEPPNESKGPDPSTDGAAMKGKFKSMDRQVMECIETMVDAWHKGVMNDDQALRSIRAYLNDLERR